MLKLRMNSIIQQQTNDSNSNYCKMPDGTLIQWGRFEVEIPANSYVEKNVQYQIQFYSSYQPQTVATIRAWDEPKNFYVLQRSGDHNDTTFRIATTASVAKTANVNWLAIGRWK